MVGQQPHASGVSAKGEGKNLTGHPTPARMHCTPHARNLTLGRMCNAYTHRACVVRRQGAIAGASAFRGTMPIDGECNPNPNPGLCSYRPHALT